VTGRLKGNLRTLMDAARTSLRLCRGSSDFRRWASTESLSPDWESRTVQSAKLIPRGASVLEFGAGRMTLRDCLPEGCRYTPCDLVDRGDGTIVCDLNARELPRFPDHDVAVFSGVLEYINDLERLISHTKRSCHMIIASYCGSEQVPGRLTRRSHGWVNDHTSSEFEEIFLRAGFACDSVQVWDKQRIYRFIRKQTGGPGLGPGRVIPLVVES
jgi:hypothetical protein